MLGLLVENTLENLRWITIPPSQSSVQRYTRSPTGPVKDPRTTESLTQVSSVVWTGLLLVKQVRVLTIHYQCLYVVVLQQIREQ